MKYALLLAVIGMVGCAFGQQANNPVCVDVNEKGTTVHYEHSWANYEGLSPAQIALAYEKLPKCIWPTSAVVEITKPAPKKPAKKYCVLTVKGKCAGYATKDEPCIVTNGTEKGVTSKPCPPAKPVIKKCSGLTGECEVESTEPTGQKPTKKALGILTSQEPHLMAPAEATGRPLTPAEAAAIVSHDCTGRQEYRDGSCRDPKAIDVPAIQETRTIKQEPCKPMEIVCGNTFIKREWTCKDKTRGLWHDEQEPPKYWCRKVQP